MNVDDSVYHKNDSDHSSGVATVVLNKSDFDHNVNESDCRVIESIRLSSKNIVSVIDDSLVGLEEKIDKIPKSIEESVGVASSDISEAVIKSNEDIGNDAIALAVFVAILGAFSAYLFNYFHWRMVRKKDNVNNIGMELIGLIEELEETALRYWIRPYDKDQKEEILVDEIRIKTIVRQIDKQAKILKKINNSKMGRNEKECIEQFPPKIFDIVTGGDFESKKRKSSKGRAMKISKSCSDVKSNIRSIVIK